MNYQQCRLYKNSPQGRILQTTYIPQKFAKVGKLLKLKDDAGNWENGWKVESVSNVVIPESQLPNWHKSIKGHRASTGDSMPKVN